MVFKRKRGRDTPKYINKTADKINIDNFFQKVYY